MRTLRLHDTGSDVNFLQALLREAGIEVPENGKFDAETKDAVKAFQRKKQFAPDAIVGRDTWRGLLDTAYTFFPKSTKYFLTDAEFISELHFKKQIILHHTAGGPRPDFTIAWWEKDTQRVATAFVIGRNAGDEENKFDGTVFRAFPEYLWAYHLGLSKTNSNINADLRASLNKTSIGIEICSYGPLVKQADGTFKTVVNNKTIPADQGTDLGTPWRGYQYFQKYTDAQIEATKTIILSMAYFFHIAIEDVTYDREWFDINTNALNGSPGIWTHVNYRKDKTDCFPQPELIRMLNGLHEASKTFIPEMTPFEVFTDRDLGNFTEEEIENYSYDLEE